MLHWLIPFLLWCVTVIVAISIAVCSGCTTINLTINSTAGNDAEITT